MAEKLEDLEASVAAAAWPAALEYALALWRRRRTAELGDLVDAIGARVVGEVPAHYEWADRACRYDPVDASTLIAYVVERGSDRAYTRDGKLAPDHAAVHAQLGSLGHDQLLTRILYMCRWLPDPRVAFVIIRWLESLAAAWPRGWYGTLGDQQPLQQLFATVATALRDVVDERSVPRLRRLVEQPPGLAHAARAGQVEIAEAALAVIDRLQADRSDAARIRALIDRVGAVARPVGPPALQRFDPDALWQQIAAAPNDDHPRQVLADALLAQGDPRGLVFAYQLGRVREINGLIRKHWISWMGAELGRIVMRRTSVFARGMLDTIRIGPGSTPVWLYEHARGHRELVAVRTVRKLMVAPTAYARFVAALPNVRTIDVDSVEMAQALGAARAVDKVTRVVVGRRDNEAPDQILAPLADRAPLSSIVVWQPAVEQIYAILGWFPTLTSIDVTGVDPAQRAALAACPVVRFV